jgi:hypothetical protein
VIAFERFGGKTWTERARKEEHLNAEDERPRAQLITASAAQSEAMQLRKGVGAEWWNDFVAKEYAEIGRRELPVGIVFWTDSERMPIDLFSYIREASRCFIIARYLAAIAMASCAIELVLNRDSRTRGAAMRRIGGWATLNNLNLITANTLGLPVQYLCSADEQIQSTPPLLFVERRNKVAHGDVMHMIATLSDYDAKAEDEALDQILKAQRFVVEWFNTAPDVQERHIANHRWPDH